VYYLKTALSFNYRSSLFVRNTRNHLPWRCGQYESAKHRKSSPRCRNSEYNSHQDFAETHLNIIFRSNPRCHWRNPLLSFSKKFGHVTILILPILHDLVTFDVKHKSRGSSQRCYPRTSTTCSEFVIGNSVLDESITCFRSFCQKLLENIHSCTVHFDTSKVLYLSN